MAEIMNIPVQSDPCNQDEQNVPLDPPKVCKDCDTFDRKHTGFVHCE